MKLLITENQRNLILELKYSNDDLLKIAGQYKTINDFRTGNLSKFSLALKRGLMNDVRELYGLEPYDYKFDHRREKDGNYKKKGPQTSEFSNLTDEQLKQEALKFKTTQEFWEQNPELYSYIYQYRNHLWNEISKHLIKLSRPQSKSGKYIVLTDIQVRRQALQYKNKQDFRDAHSGLYQHIIKYRKDLWKEIEKNFNPLGNRVSRMVYAYEFPNHKVAYIGLTDNEDRRHREHTTDESRSRRLSSVYLFMQKNNVRPVKKVISSGYIDWEDAAILEKKTMLQYEKSGWKLLNIREGGGLGATRQFSDKQIIDIAKQYNDRDEFRTKNPSKYSSALKRGLMNSIRYIYGEPSYEYSTPEPNQMSLVELLKDNK